MALTNDNIIQLISGIVDNLRNSGTIISETYNATKGQLTLELSNSFDLQVNYFIEINGQQYKIIKFTSGTPYNSVVIKTSGVLGQTTFKLPYPYFYHGTYQMINKEFNNTPEQNQKLPCIMFIYHQREKRFLDNLSAYSREIPMQFAFLGESQIDFTSDNHQTILDNQHDMVEKFIIQLKNNPFVGKLSDAEKTYIPNYGVFSSDKGNLSTLVDIQATGILLNIDVPIHDNFDSCNIADFKFYKCAPGMIKEPDGTLIQLLNAGETYTTEKQSNDIAYKRPQLTGQTTSYHLYDDAWHLANGTYDYTEPLYPKNHAKLLNHTTLVHNNAFGNTNRFTDINGLQVYGDDYVIDHYTGLGWYRILSNNINFANSIAAAAASTQNSYNNWRVPNDAESYSIAYFELADTFNYSPFNLTATMWSSTTYVFDTSFGRRQTTNGVFGATPKTTLLSHLIVRNHYT